MRSSEQGHHAERSRNRAPGRSSIHRFILAHRSKRRRTVRSALASSVAPVPLLSTRVLIYCTMRHVAYQFATLANDFRMPVPKASKAPPTLGIIPNGTTRVASISALPAVLERLGVRLEPMLDAVGLPRSPFEAADSVVDVGTAKRLLDLAAVRARCPHLGLLCGQRHRPETIGIAVRRAQCARDVGSVLRGSALKLHLDGHEFVRSLTVTPDVVEFGLRLATDRPGLTWPAVDLGMAGAFAIVQAVCGPEWTPTGVLLVRQSGRSCAPYDMFYGVPVQFGTNRNAMAGAAGSRRHPRQPGIARARAGRNRRPQPPSTVYRDTPRPARLHRPRRCVDPGSGGSVGPASKGPQPATGARENLGLRTPAAGALPDLARSAGEHVPDDQRHRRNPHLRLHRAMHTRAVTPIQPVVPSASIMLPVPTQRAPQPFDLSLDCWIAKSEPAQCLEISTPLCGRCTKPPRWRRPRRQPVEEWHPFALEVRWAGLPAAKLAAS